MTGSPRTPIAVIGAACRFPGGIDTPEAFWSALSDGRDLAGAHGGRAPPGAGGRVEDPGSVDAAAVQISPREAAQMDPHQRVFLQVACEAFLDAGLTRARLMGTRTGVVAGVYASDYLLMRARRPETVMAHTAGGVSHAVVANRVSYALNFSGPSLQPGVQ